MNSQTRSKSRLLARASTIAILAAAGQFGVVAQAQAACLNITAPTTTINSAQECAQVVSNTVTSVTNNAIVGPPPGGGPGFFIGGEGSITGELLNNNTISGGTVLDGALTIGDGADVAGGIRNTGQIISGSGNAISLGYETTDTFVSPASLTGNITNSGAISGATNGILAQAGTMSGQLVNNANGVISGGNAGVFIRDSFTSWSGGISNSGNILGNSAGIQVGSLTGTGAGDVDFAGGIQNNSGGTISSLTGPAIIAGGNSFSGGINNNGLITQRDLAAAGGEGSYAGVGVVVSAETFGGGITNGGEIEGLGGPAIWVTSENATFNGDITNFNLIEATGGASDAHGILIESNAFNGSVTNYGLITGNGNGVWIEPSFFTGNVNNYNYINGGSNGVLIQPGRFRGNVTNTGNIIGNNAGGLIISSDQIDGSEGVASEIVNNNHIRGRMTGLGIYGIDVHANITNERQNYPNSPLAIIEGTSGVGLAISAENWTGNITNAGTILGEASFDLIQALGPSLVEGGSGTGLYINAHTFDGVITNSGTIQGDSEGVGIYVVAASSSECECTVEGTFNGSITNSGLIQGDSGVGLSIESGSIGGSFDGTITNASSGIISGGNAGVVIELGGDYTGNVVNNGRINGGNVGLDFSVADFTGDFINNGTIHGDIDGANISANSIDGDLTNNGTIIGEGFDTAWHITAGSMSGNITNTNYLSAASNALHVDIVNFTGQVINSGGLIEATSGGTAVFLNIGNGTTFRNAGDVDGDVVFNNPTSSPVSYIYSAGNGSIDGSLLGQIGVGGLNDDTIVVDGVHSFVGGTATNFASFTVANGGEALMGASSMGGPSASPYSFTNVGALNVNSGGTLYIDQGTTLNVTSYTQQSGGTLMFDLGAPSGLASATGTIVAGAADYGQIIVTGPVTLSGTIAGWLDPAFASANAALEEVIYNDVITSNAPITTDFTTTALVANNSLFQLFDLIDGNTVDLRVARSPLGQFPSVNAIVGTNDPFDGNIADRTNGIGSAGCGLAGGGWCFNRFAANEPGATQVMTDASPGEDPFAWLRTGVRRVGETAVWGRGVGVWGDTDGEVAAGIPGTDFSLAGAIVGIDHVFTTTLLAGLAAQWTSTDVDFDGRRDNADVDSLELGAYGSWGDTRLYLNANVSYIWHDFEIRRFDGPDSARGTYDGSTISAYAEGGKIFETESGVRIQPIVAVSYSHLDTDAYRETGTAATLLDVFAADLDSLKGMVGGRFAYPFQLESGRKWVPEARLVWSHEFMDDQASHFVDVQGGPVIKTLISGEEFSRDSLVAGAGVTVPVTDDATMFVDYDATLSSDVTIHTVSAGARLRW